ncbi:carbohydrate ABC transporter permease (plasmid) [Nicoliella spurrieriana]|uniref:Carbohydrate ABC transporter permease n=1 Tax=Nicoliella spurrieriana TaxID=2925830 RepID=A0A976RQT1_9LACO|nr:carbohydrate ABC transporter permease [Nicoliella spurrieriana]UQS86079.1 carbohydrate ABC transporter permease [Nicoliella spurrieriana]
MDIAKNTQVTSKSKINVSSILQYGGLIILALIVMGPFLFGLWTSFLPTNSIAKGSLSGSLTIDNYVAAIKTTPVLGYLFNSFVVSILRTIGEVFFCSLAAYAFVFLKFKGRNVIFYLFLATMMLPFEAEVIPNFMTVKSMNLLNTYSVMVIPFLTSAFGTFMLRQAFLQMPKDLKEESDIEGLSHFQYYWHVALPYSKITLLTLAAYSFLSSWNEYLWPTLTTFSDKYRTVQAGLRQMQSTETFNNWGMIMASAIIVVIPTLVILFIGQHFFKSGLNDGSVK